MCTLLPFPCRISCRLVFTVAVCTVARRYSEVNFPLSSVLPRPDQLETDSTGNCCWFFPFKLANHLCVTDLFLVSLYQSASYFCGISNNDLVCRDYSIVTPFLKHQCFLSTYESVELSRNHILGSVVISNLQMTKVRLSV